MLVQKIRSRSIIFLQKINKKIFINYYPFELVKQNLPGKKNTINYVWYQNIRPTGHCHNSQLSFLFLYIYIKKIAVTIIIINSSLLAYNILVCFIFLHTFYFGENTILVPIFLGLSQFDFYILIAINLVPAIFNLQLIWSILLNC